MLNKRLVVLLAASLLATSCWAAADDGDDKDATGDPNGGAPSVFDKLKPKKKEEKKQTSSSVSEKKSQELPRVWIGLTGSFTPLKLLKAYTGANPPTNQTTGDTIVMGFQGGAPLAQGQAGGGVMLNARIIKSFWLSVGGIYRFTGYDWEYDSGDTSDFAQERSRIRLIDIPVLVKYTGKKWNASKYTFYELGGTYRDVLSRTTTHYNTSTAVFGTGIISPSNNSIGGSNFVYNKHSVGATAGVGFTAKDDFGIIVSPEFRYTRWMSDTFSNVIGGVGLLGTQRNQIEVTVSFGF